MTVKTLALGAAALLAGLAPAAAQAAIVGPSAYLCFDAAASGGCGTADSPFKSRTYSYFHLETFEDGLLNTPGVTQTGGSVIGPFSFVDSVDADSGPVDGDGSTGRSLFGSNLAEFRFDAVALGQLPTDVGLVFTDGNNVTFEFYDAADVLLGSATAVGDGFFIGQTAEDRFIGWSGNVGVARIRVLASAFEVDHLQYGLFRAPPNGAIPEPASWAMMIAGFGAIGGAARRRRSLAVTA